MSQKSHDFRTDPISFLGANDAGARSSLQRLLQAIDAHPPLPVGFDPSESFASEAEHPQGGKDRAVRRIAHDDVDGWRAEQAIALNVPTDVAQHLVPCGDESG